MTWKWDPERERACCPRPTLNLSGAKAACSRLHEGLVTTDEKHALSGSFWVPGSHLTRSTHLVREQLCYLSPPPPPPPSLLDAFPSPSPRSSSDDRAGSHESSPAPLVPLRSPNHVSQSSFLPHSSVSLLTVSNIMESSASPSCNAASNPLCANGCGFFGCVHFC